MKRNWFAQWLERDFYAFWYKERDNEIWKNDKFIIVWHPAIGIRLMIPVGHFSEEYLCKVFIPDELAKQEV